MLTDLIKQIENINSIVPIKYLAVWILATFIVVYILIKMIRKYRTRKYIKKILKQVEDKRYFHDYVKEAFFYSKSEYSIPEIEYFRKYIIINVYDISENKLIQIPIDLLDEYYINFFEEVERLSFYEEEQFDKEFEEWVKEEKKSTLWNFVSKRIEVKGKEEIEKEGIITETEEELKLLNSEIEKENDNDLPPLLKRKK